MNAERPVAAQQLWWWLVQAGRRRWKKFMAAVIDSEVVQGGSTQVTGALWLTLAGSVMYLV